MACCYSVPHALVGTTVDLRVTETLVKCFQANQRVACHALSSRRGYHTTTHEYMPASHRAHLQWTPQKLIDWGLRIPAGVNADRGESIGRALRCPAVDRLLARAVGFQQLAHDHGQRNFGGYGLSRCLGNTDSVLSSNAGRVNTLKSSTAWDALARHSSHSCRPCRQST